MSTQLPDQISSRILSTVTSYGMTEIEVSPLHLIEVVRELYQNEATEYQFLTDLCGIHIQTPVEKLGIVIHLHNLQRNERLRIKCYVESVTGPKIPTLTAIFSAANWMERETYDFFGIEFVGHPNLIRILNDESMTVFPMLKTYPLEDSTREDKDDRMFGR